MRRNVEAFERYAALLREGRVTAIFPEGLTQDDPHLAPVKTGAARIAVQAEDAADFTLQLAVVPVGLQFEPRRRFRADAFVRFGEPFTISDLAPQHAEAPRRAVQELTDRIGAALKSVAYHVESTEQIPFVERLADVYFRRARRTGIAGVRGRGLRGELLQKMTVCLNYYVEADRESVTEVERALERYERLREKAGLDRGLLEEPSRLLPGPLAPVQATGEAILGLVPALFSFLTGAIPYYAAKRFASAPARATATLQRCRSDIFRLVPSRSLSSTGSRSRGSGRASAALPPSCSPFCWSPPGCSPASGPAACASWRSISVAASPRGSSSMPSHGSGRRRISCSSGWTSCATGTARRCLDGPRCLPPSRAVRPPSCQVLILRPVCFPLPP